MSFLRNRYFVAIAVFASLTAAYHLFCSSVIWAIVLTVLVPLLMGVAIHAYLERNQYTDEWTDAEWRSCKSDSEYSTSSPWFLRN